MQLTFDTELIKKYTSTSQKVRVLTEAWVSQSVYCPNCGQSQINNYSNNKPVADFYCLRCNEEYELKSKRDIIGTKVVDGAYHTMIERLQSKNNPNFFFLNYNLSDYSVKNFFVIPKHFFVPEIIEERKPLAPTAHRAGWIGCNILLRGVPQSGKIFYVRNGTIEPKDQVLLNWKKTLFLQEEEVAVKGWLLDVMRSVEKIRKREFALDDVYAFKDELGKLHPENGHVKDKIRQQLQILRDRGYLEFTARGKYRLTEL